MQSDASRTDTDVMRAQPAQWSDVLEALILEAAALGEGVAREDDRARLVGHRCCDRSCNISKFCCAGLW